MNHVRPRQDRELLRSPIKMLLAALVCAIAMIISPMVGVQPARADQDGGIRIEIDNSNTVGQWNISQPGQVVNLAVGQQVAITAWDDSGIPIIFDSLPWYVNNQFTPLRTYKDGDAVREWTPETYVDYDDTRTNSNRDIDCGQSLCISSSSGTQGHLVALRPGETEVKVKSVSGTATARFVIHDTKLKLVRTADSTTLTENTTTALTAGENVVTKYYPTFEGDGTNSPSKRYSYEFTTSLWSVRNTYNTDQYGNAVDSAKPTGWTVSNPGSTDFNGPNAPTGDTATIRSLKQGDSTVRLESAFVLRHNVAETSTDSKGKTVTKYLNKSQLYDKKSLSTNIRVGVPTISASYGSSTSPVILNNGDRLPLSAGEILHLDNSVSPLHKDYATVRQPHWDSENKQVAIIDSDSSRKLTALDQGTTKVTATIGGVTFQINVTVSAPKLSLTYQGKLPEPVDTSGKTMELTAGESANLTMGYAQRHDYTQLNTVTWTSSNTAVAIVNTTSGVSNAGAYPKTTITAKKPGKTVIAGTIAGRKVQTTVHVVDAKLDILRQTGLSTTNRDDDDKIAITNQRLEATAGEVFSLYTRISPTHDYASFPSNVTRTTWTENSFNKVLQLRPSGDSTTVQALSSQGKESTTDVITASAGGRTATVTVTVRKPKLSIVNTINGKKVDVTGSTLKLRRNDQLHLVSQIQPLHTDYATLSNNIVKWASSDSSVIYLNSENAGNGSARNKGHATISATTDGVTAKTNAEVINYIRSIDSVRDVTTNAGVKPNLPPSVTAHWDDGTTSSVPVTWESINPEKYRKENRNGFLVKGTVTNYSGTVQVRVRVVQGILHRVAGANRYFTMAELVQSGKWSEGGTVIIASGTNYPDALAAAGLAGVKNAPIVLTDPNELSPQAEQTLQRLKPQRVIIAGGTAAVSGSIKNHIWRGYTHNVIRASGSTRIGTSMQLYAEGIGSWGDTAIIATSANYADALSISSYAYAKKAPVFLCDPDTGLTTQQRAALGKFKHIVVAGGTSAVPSRHLNGFNVKRLSGATRYDTSLAIARYALGNGMKSDNLVFATGANFADALAAGPLAGKTNSIMLLAENASSPTVDYASQLRNETSNAVIAGGENAVSRQTAVRIANNLGLKLS